jgi:hypothetical protein
LVALAVQGHLLFTELGVVAALGFNGAWASYRGAARGDPLALAAALGLTFFAVRASRILVQLWGDNYPITGLRHLVIISIPPPISIENIGGRVRTAGSRFVRDDKEPGPSWGK